MSTRWSAVAACNAALTAASQSRRAGTNRTPRFAAVSASRGSPPTSRTRVCDEAAIAANTAVRTCTSGSSIATTATWLRASASIARAFARSDGGCPASGVPANIIHSNNRRTENASSRDTGATSPHSGRSACSTENAQAAVTATAANAPPTRPILGPAIPRCLPVRRCSFLIDDCPARARSVNRNFRW